MLECQPIYVKRATTLFQMLETQPMSVELGHGAIPNVTMPLEVQTESQFQEHRLITGWGVRCVLSATTNVLKTAVFSSCVRNMYAGRINFFVKSCAPSSCLDVPVRREVADG
jgi:hypothetical protein